MNYKVITDIKLLESFIEWLPELGNNECYYLCLFARSKYCKNEDGTNKFPHIKSDKSQLKRFVATSKDWIIYKIKQLEVEYGSYTGKHNIPIPQEGLALYITPNPRSMERAMYKLMRRFIDIQECKGMNYNINSEALSAIQKSPARKVYFDLDLDDIETIKIDETKINKDCLHFLKTRGGLHVLVELDKVAIEFKKSWYNYITKSFRIDIKGDCMIPVPGCNQGNFTPHFIDL